MFYSTIILLASLSATMEVTNEPVAYVIDYGDMEDISLKAEDVLVFSYDIPQVESVENPGVTYTKRSMAEMMAAVVPEPAPESKPTLPNESRFKKRLDHTPPFTGTVTGDVTVVKGAANQRIVVVSNIKGDGVMQILIKGNTAKRLDGQSAKSIMNTPMVMVRNSKPPSEAKMAGAQAMTMQQVDSPVRSSLESHYKGAVPNNLRVVASPVTVE